MSLQKQQKAKQNLPLPPPPQAASDSDVDLDEQDFDVFQEFGDRVEFLSALPLSAEVPVAKKGSQAKGIAGSTAPARCAIPCQLQHCPLRHSGRRDLPLIQAEGHAQA